MEVKLKELRNIVRVSADLGVILEVSTLTVDCRFLQWASSESLLSLKISAQLVQLFRCPVSQCICVRGGQGTTTDGRVYADGGRFKKFGPASD